MFRSDMNEPLCNIIVDETSKEKLISNQDYISYLKKNIVLPLAQSEKGSFFEVTFYFKEFSFLEEPTVKERFERKQEVEKYTLVLNAVFWNYIMRAESCISEY